MRVLQIVHGFPPASSGGTEVYTLALSRALRAAGDEVFVLAREADADRPDLVVRDTVLDGFPVRLVNNLFRHCRSFEESYRSPRIRALAASWLDEVRPEVVHVQHLTGLSTEILPELACRGLPTLLTLHDYWLLCHRGQLLDLDLRPCAAPPCDRCVGPEVHKGTLSTLAQRLSAASGPLSRRLGRAGAELRQLAASHTSTGAEMRRRSEHVRQALGGVDHLVALSRTVEEHFAAFGVPRDRLSRSSPGIDLRRFEGIRRSPRAPHAPLRLGYVGSLMVSKGASVLLDALALLPRGSATLQVYGAFSAYHGDDRYREALGPRLHAEGVVHAGAVPHEELPARLAALDVLVVPSIWLENAPLVIREAFACGLPVVASDLGGMAEAVQHERNGLLFRAGDAEDLARTLRRLVDEPALLPRLGAGVSPPRSIEDDAIATRARYAELVRARRPHRHGGPKPLHAVVLNYRTPSDTLLCVRSLESSSRPPDRIIVIDNGSEDGSEERLRAALPRAEVRSSGLNLGFSAGTNLGIVRALETGAERVLLVNGDALLAPSCLGALEDALEASPALGIVGPVVLRRSRPDLVETLGMSYEPRTGRMRHLGAGATLVGAAPPALRHVAAVSGAVMLVDRRVFDRAGLFDPEYFFSFEDLDLCLRARAMGLETAVVGPARAYHHGSLSIGARSPERIYYAMRNHLRVAERAATGRTPLERQALVTSVLGLNLLHVLLTADAPVGAGIVALARGVGDHARRRYGPFAR